MIPKYLACVFAALTLAGCCASGTTCEPHTTGPNVAAWDGLGAGPEDITPAKKTISRPRKDAAVQPKGELPADAKPTARNEVVRQEAENRADDARLVRRLRICNGCLPSRDMADDPMGSVPH
jgi:hypothetical protein